MATTITIESEAQQYSDLVLGGVLSTDLGTGKKEINLTRTNSLQIGSVLAADGTEATSAADADSVFVFSDVAFTIHDVNIGDQFTGVAVTRGFTLNRYRVYDNVGNPISYDYVSVLEAKGLKLTDKILATS